MGGGGVVATFFITLQFNCIYCVRVCVCVCGGGGVKFLLLHFDLQSFELAMQTSHPSLYSTKTLYLYISDPF